MGLATDRWARRAGLTVTRAGHVVGGDSQAPRECVFVDTGVHVHDVTATWAVFWCGAGGWGEAHFVKLLAL